jgi:hypothetical protein
MDLPIKGKPGGARKFAKGFQRRGSEENEYLRRELDIER